MDEPTSGLDPATTEKIHELIEEERKKERLYCESVCSDVCRNGALK